MGSRKDMTIILRTFGHFPHRSNTYSKNGLFSVVFQAPFDWLSLRFSWAAGDNYS